MTIYEYLGLSKDNLKTIDVNRSYVSFRIKKRDGKRTRRIDAPVPMLKEIQKKFLNKILYMYRPHNIAHGFIKYRSPRTNAEAHVGRKSILQVDIQDFFPSIDEKRVYTTLLYLFNRKREFDMPTSEDIALFAHLLCLNGVLPQGSPASPALTNLMCYEVDRLLHVYEKKYNCTITRYADDITASFDNLDSKVIEQLLNGIKHALLKNGFQVNNKKIKRSFYYNRQQITGVVVNTKLNTPKTSWRNLRAALHQASFGEVTEKRQQQLRGQIEWLKSLNPQRGNQFLEKFGQISVQKPLTSLPTSEQTPSNSH